MSRSLDSSLRNPEGNAFLASLLAEKFRLLGIHDVIFDLDGTLVDTRDVFHTAMVEAAGLLVCGQNWHDRPGAITWPQFLQAIEAYHQIDQAILHLRPVFGVKPQVMEEAVLTVADSLTLPKTHDHTGLAVARILRIYSADLPRLFAGAHRLVDLVNATHLPTYLFTHAEPAWTAAKLTGADLSHNFSQIVCFDTSRPKSEQLPSKLSQLGIDPSASLGIGDNPEADVYSLIKLGGRAVLVRNDQADVYGGHEQSVAISQDERLLAVSHIDMVADALITAF